MRLKKLLRHGAVYTAGAMARRVMPLVMVPFLTRVLTREDYGLVAMFTILTSFATPIITLSTPVALMRSHFKLDEDTQRRHVGTALLRILLLGGLFTLILHVGRHVLAPVAAFEPDWLWTVGVAATAAGITDVALRLWQARQQPLSYVSFQLSVSALELAATLVLILVLMLDWRGRIGGRLLAIGIGCVVVIVWLVRRRIAEWTFDREASRELSKFGLPLLPTALSILGMAIADRWFVASLVSVADAGLYAVGVQVAAVLRILVSALNSTWVPFVLQQLAEGGAEGRRWIARGSLIGSFAFVGVALLLGLLAPYVLGVFVGPRFQAAAPYVFWLALAFAGRGTYTFVLGHYYHTGKTKRLGSLSVVALVLNLVLCPILILQMGPIGAAISTCTVYWTHALLAVFLRPTSEDSEPEATENSTD